MRAVKILIAVVLTVPSGVNLGASPASASPDPESVMRQETSQQCLAAQESAAPSRQHDPSACRVTIVAGPSETRRLTAGEADEARRVAGIVNDTNPVYSRTYQYTIYQGTDQENMKGRYYYDGFHVWQMTSYRGYVGSKSCWVSYSITYSIDILRCDGGGLSTSSIAAHMQLRVTLAKITPITWREDYYVTMKPNGTSSIRKA